MVKLLEERFKLPTAIAAQSHEALMTSGFGLSADARFNLDGFRNVFAMRAEMEGQWGGRQIRRNSWTCLTTTGRLAWLENSASGLSTTRLRLLNAINIIACYACI
jgi:hypothetical protein